MQRALLAFLCVLGLATFASAQSYPQVSTYCNSSGSWIPCTNGGGGGGAGGTTQDADDASVASGQTMDVVMGLSQVYDGSVWRRLTIGTAGTASSQVLTVQGIASMTPVRVDNGGTFATQAAQSGTWTVQPGNTANTTPWLVAGNVTPADNTSPTNAAPVTNYNMCYDGTNWDRCTVSTGGSGTIDANTTRVVIATDDPVNDFAVKGDANMVAHDAVDAGNPLKIGAKATTSLSSPTPVANADRTDLFADADGALLVREHSNLADRVSAVVGVTDGSSTSLVSAQGAGIRFCATAVTVSNSSATNVTVDLRDGTAGSVIWTFPAAGNMGGATLTFPTPLCTSANTALAMDPSASATTVTVSIIGFKTKL